jgi:integrase
MARAEHILGKQLQLVLASLLPANRLVCEVMLHTGLRVSDVLELRTDMLRKSSRFWICEAKTGKAKLCGFPADLRERLLEQAGPEWVFESPRDPKKHRTRQAVWNDIKRAEKAFRLRQNCGTHSMRKDYAQEMLQRFGSVEKVRKALNHSSETVTRLYIMADAIAQRKGMYTKRVQAQTSKRN